MQIRRCAALLVELDDTPRFDVGSLFDGGDGLDRRPRWLAHAPGLDGPCEVTLAQLAILGELPAESGVARADLEGRHGRDDVDALWRAGLLVATSPEPSAAARRDQAAREVPWWPMALAAQHAGAWQGVDVAARQQAGAMPSAADLVAANGPAPTHEHRCRPDTATFPLPAPARCDFDALLAKRRTCRNFDANVNVSLGALATMLHRVWGAVGTRELAPGAVAVKKTSPAGGGLHAIEAYLLVRRVDGLAPGFYHYLPLRHHLEPLATLSDDEAAAQARRFLAGQAWFEQVPVLVVMVARFDRLFWKYRGHAKAWRVVHLDAGHLSQTMYLSAAELGLGAFVTAAINDRDIETALALPPLREGALAIVGFGPVAEGRSNIELDDLVPTPAALMSAVD